MFRLTFVFFGATLGPVWHPFGSTLVQLWDPSGVSLGSLWGIWGITLELLWYNFRVISITVNGGITAAITSGPP